MSNAVEKIMAVFLALLLLVLAPVMYTAQKADSLAQTVVSRVTREFVDKIKTTGRLNTEMYTQFIHGLDSTKNIYNVEIIHQHYNVDPVFVDGEVTGVNEYYLDDYTDDILGVLEKDGVYYFRQGDYVSISVRNRTGTMSERMLDSIFRTRTDGSIHITYGGIIRDSIPEGGIP